MKLNHCKKISANRAFHNLRTQTRCPSVQVGYLWYQVFAKFNWKICNSVNKLVKAGFQLFIKEPLITRLVRLKRYLIHRSLMIFFKKFKMRSSCRAFCATPALFFSWGWCRKFLILLSCLNTWLAPSTICFTFKKRLTFPYPNASKLQEILQSRFNTCMHLKLCIAILKVTTFLLIKIWMWKYAISVSLVLR